MGFDALNAAQKTSALGKVPVLKKLRNTTQNGQKSSKWSKVTIIVGCFLIFSEMVLCREMGFLGCIQCLKTLLLSYQNQQSDNFSDFLPSGGTL